MNVAVEMRSRHRAPDPKEIAREIMKGSSFDQVQKKYGIKMRSQLLELYTTGLRQLQEIPAKAPAKEAKAKRQRRINTRAQRTIGTSGTITLTRSLLVEDLGFQEGDSFSVSRRGNTIILEKVD